jgi:hypothetical protein
MAFGIRWEKRMFDTYSGASPPNIAAIMSLTGNNTDPNNRFSVMNIDSEIIIKEYIVKYLPFAFNVVVIFLDAKIVQKKIKPFDFIFVFLHPIQKQYKRHTL